MHHSEQYYQMISEKRKTKIKEIIDHRLSSITIVLENIYDSHNANAVIRTCEAFGITTLHLIQTAEPFFTAKRIVAGSSKWVDVKIWQNAKECFDFLHQNNFVIYTSAIHHSSISIWDIEFNQQTALVFGNEHAGISEMAHKLTDGNFIIPMYGFTESFNISVAAGISASIACMRRRQFLNSAGDLSLQQKTNMEKYFLEKSLPKSLRPRITVESV